MNIQELFTKTIAAHASDLHLVAGTSPTLRVDGRLTPISSYPPLTAAEILEMSMSILSENQKHWFSEKLSSSLHELQFRQANE